jgi:hypothetical protein
MPDNSIQELIEDIPSVETYVEEDDSHPEDQPFNHSENSPEIRGSGSAEHAENSKLVGPLVSKPQTETSMPSGEAQADKQALESRLNELLARAAQGEAGLAGVRITNVNVTDQPFKPEIPTQTKPEPELPTPVIEYQQEDTEAFENMGSPVGLGELLAAGAKGTKEVEEREAAKKPGTTFEGRVNVPPAGQDILIESLQPEDDGKSDDDKYETVIVQRRGLDVAYRISLNLDDYTQQFNGILARLESSSRGGGDQGVHDEIERLNNLIAVLESDRYQRSHQNQPEKLKFFRQLKAEFEGRKAFHESWRSFEGADDTAALRRNYIGMEAEWKNPIIRKEEFAVFHQHFEIWGEEFDDTNPEAFRNRAYQEGVNQYLNHPAAGLTQAQIDKRRSLSPAQLEENLKPWLEIAYREWVYSLRKVTQSKTQGSWDEGTFTWHKSSNPSGGEFAARNVIRWYERLLGRGKRLQPKIQLLGQLDPTGTDKDGKNPVAHIYGTNINPAYNKIDIKDRDFTEDTINDFRSVYKKDSENNFVYEKDNNGNLILDANGHEVQVIESNNLYVDNIVRAFGENKLIGTKRVRAHLMNPKEVKDGADEDWKYVVRDKLNYFAELDQDYVSPDGQTRWAKGTRLYEILDYQKLKGNKHNPYEYWSLNAVQYVDDFRKTVIENENSIITVPSLEAFTKTLKQRFSDFASESIETYMRDFKGNLDLLIGKEHYGDPTGKTPNMKPGDLESSNIIAFRQGIITHETAELLNKDLYENRAKYEGSKMFGEKPVGPNKAMKDTWAAFYTRYEKVWNHAVTEAGKRGFWGFLGGFLQAFLKEFFKAAKPDVKA